MIKQLWDKDIKAKSPYPAQIRIFLDSGVKIFKTLNDAAPTLEKMGIPIKVDPKEELNRELLQDQWSVARGTRG